MTRPWRGDGLGIAVTPPSQSHHWPRRPQRERNEHTPEVEVYDWDEEELDILRRCGLKYTIRSSKYPRTVKNPSRTLLILNNNHDFSAHTYLLTHFSTVLSKLIKSQPASSSPSPSPTPVHLNLPPVISYSAFTLFLRWLYNPDKIPLQDYTPFRPPNISDKTIFEAALLASPAVLGAAKFEKWLLRIIYYEIWFGLLPVSFLTELKPRLEDLNLTTNKLTSEPYYKATGLWWFSHAYLAWTDPVNARNAGELDPYRWRVEHWYSICGRGGNWGCFHAMNTSGWGGVWERQRANLEGIRRRGVVDARMMGALREIVGEGMDKGNGEGRSSGNEWEAEVVVRQTEMVVRPNAPSNKTASGGPGSAPRSAKPPLARPHWSRIPIPRPPVGKHTVHAHRSRYLRNGPPSSSDRSGEELWVE